MKNMNSSPTPAISSGRPDGRTRLRDATRADHERLHRQPAFAALADGSLDLPAYRALLARLYGFHATLERLVGERIDANLTDWADLRAPRANWLWRDLRDLGADEDELARLPLAEPGLFPDLADEGRLVGCLYVRAGSTLGGRLMAKGLDPLLGAGGENGRRFLSGCGGADAQWRQCCAAIERVTAAGRWDAMREGAVVTFAALEDWMNGGA